MELLIIGVLGVGVASAWLTSSGRERQEPPPPFESQYSGIVIRLTGPGRNPFLRLGIRVEFPDGEPAWGTDNSMSRTDLDKVVWDSVTTELRPVQEAAAPGDKQEILNELEERVNRRLRSAELPCPVRVRVTLPGTQGSRR